MICMIRVVVDMKIEIQGEVIGIDNYYEKSDLCTSIFLEFQITNFTLYKKIELYYTQSWFN